MRVILLVVAGLQFTLSLEGTGSPFSLATVFRLIATRHGQPPCSVYSRQKGAPSEMKPILLTALLFSGLMPAVAQVKKEDLATRNTKSPGAETSVTINGKTLWIYYHAPSVRGRHIFNGAGALQPDGSVWRLGADYATVLHTDGNLDLNGLAIPKGDYTLYIDLDNGQWKLIVNKALMAGGKHIWGVGISPDGVHEGATTNDPATELGRVSLTMAKPSSPVETLKIRLSGAPGPTGKLLIGWENVTASAPFTVK